MTGSTFTGKLMSLSIRGASHAREIGMTLKGFPKGFAVDRAALQAFMERRAPGRDDTSTARKEPDVPVFKTGLTEANVTDGGTIDAIIRNTDTRSQDYQCVKSVPRPGHSDYPVWVKTGIIPAGGGCHSGRLTAPMCIAGGLCKQWLAKRGISVTASTTRKPEEILAVKKEGDSIGGEIVCTVTGAPKGLGWAMFEGLESELAAAIYGIPGVKALSFGDGAQAAGMKGTEFNDALAPSGRGASAHPAMRATGDSSEASMAPTTVGGGPQLLSNHSGGLTGGMTNGAPIVMHVTMRPTASIYKEQDSVDLTTGAEQKLIIKGRHDPCITIRAVPVVEALTSLVLMDRILFEESLTPRICLTLLEKTVEEDLKVLAANRDHVDMCELRVDHLEGEGQLAQVLDFPAKAGVPVILTLRRQNDGGNLPNDDEIQREAAFSYILTEGKGFAFVDFEDDFRRPHLEELAKAHGARVIRSFHDFSGKPANLRQKLRDMRRNTDEIPKVAYMPKSPDEVTEAFEELKGFREFPHIVCAMGRLGQVTRILAGRLGNFLTFCSVPSPKDGGDPRTPALGHLTPDRLVSVYRFRTLTDSTQIYSVTGWPLEVTSSPELNNYAFANEQEDKVLVPFPAETVGQFMRFANAVDLKGSAVTVPHKEAIMKYCTELDPAAKAIGAVNTFVKTANGWKGYNTDAPGFAAALKKFLGVETLKDVPVILVGAGGAAKAVAYALHELGADVCIYNRTKAKAEEIAAKYWFRYGEMPGEDSGATMAPAAVGGGLPGGGPLRDPLFPAKIIINATSVGLNDPEADAFPALQFKGDEKVYDIVYHPETTKLMARCRAAGGEAQNGFTMLINQAIAQREIYYAQ